MGLPMNALAVLLVSIAAASAIPAHFPHGQVVTYNYYADIKTGTVEPAPYVSQFALDGLLHIKQDISDPTLKNAYYVTLSDLKYGLHNGRVEHHEWIDTSHPVVEQAKMIQDPFLVVYDENGKFQGVKLLENESGWSKNIKQAIASMLQLDFPSIFVQTPVKSHSFVTKENTIHGVCHVAYDVHTRPQTYQDAPQVLVVTKNHDPKNCSHFVQRAFDHCDREECLVQPEDDMTTSCAREVELEHRGDHVMITRLVGHGAIHTFPWKATSEVHYITTNQTLTLKGVTPIVDIVLPVVNFQSFPIIRDITFNKPQGNYALHAAEDVTQGRHIVKLDVLIPKLKKMLGEAADYLEENHLEMKDPDWKHGQTINRLQHTMSYMDLGSLEQVYNVIQDAKTPREVTMKNIFLEMIPNLGTTAGCLFTRNVVRKHKVSDFMAITMLIKLPRHVKAPSERLLLEMEDLVKFGETVSTEVRKASILCFATLIHKTFVHEHSRVVHPFLDRYLQHFLDHVKNEPSYQMKMVYLMAIKNVEVGNIHKLLEPIIRGDIAVSENPHHIRVQAIWAIKKAIHHDSQYCHDLLWPILTNVDLPLTIRVVAYDVLMSQMPNMGRMMSMHWFMMTEQDDDLYNYHLTTITSWANSVDPCLQPVREMARKVLRITKVRPVHSTLSCHLHHSYHDPKYGHGESVLTSLIYDSHTEFPHAGSVEHVITAGRKPINVMGIHWSASGVSGMAPILKQLFGGMEVEPITNEKVKKILTSVAQMAPYVAQPVHIDICVTMNDHVVSVHHFDKFQKIFDHKQWQLAEQWKSIGGSINWQNIVYDTLHEMHVPTDMGVPAVLATRVPYMFSLKLNPLLSEIKMPLNVKVELDARIWSHGDTSMSIYNPIADIWHSVRRVITQDVVFPVDMNIGYNQIAKSLKVTFPRLPLTKFSVGGIMTHAKNYVTVTEDETDVLKTHCATCHHHEAITKSTVDKKYHQSVVDSKDTGLQYSMFIFGCESNATPVTHISELFRAFHPEHKSTWNNVWIQSIMAVRQTFKNFCVSPPVGTCGFLAKMEPSIVHPTSHVTMNIRANMEDLDHTHETLHVLSSKKVNVRGTVNVTAASTDTSVRSWDVNVNFDTTQGHLNNNLKVQMTRITPGERNVKVCVDAQSNYPVNDVDPLQVGTTKEETTTKVSLTMGQTDDDKCVRDDTVMTMTVKGEMSDEQKKHMHNNPCTLISEPVLNKKHLLKSWECIQHALRYTTLRKYTVNFAHKKLPPSVMATIIWLHDLTTVMAMPHIKYTADHTETGLIKMMLEYPEETDHLEMSVVTPVCGYEYIDLPLGAPLWNLLMQNIRFSIPALYKHFNNQLRMCTFEPPYLITAGNYSLSAPISGQWMLISGDHVHHTFAVFAKIIENNWVAVRVHVGTHTLEITPTDTTMLVTVDDQLIEHYEKGIVVPPAEHDTYAIKMTKNYQHLVIQSQQVPVILLCTPTGVHLILDTVLHGQVSGLCGSMDVHQKSATVMFM